MANMVDDPTTYLKRDASTPVVALACNLSNAQALLKHYGIAVQAAIGGLVGGGGVWVVTTMSEALVARANLPQATLWCIVPDGPLSSEARAILYGYFGQPLTVHEALNVKTDGIAWRPEKFG